MAGKTTQAKELARTIGVPYVHPVCVLRKRLGLHENMRVPHVSDICFHNWIIEALTTAGRSSGQVILDGYPRDHLSLMHFVSAVRILNAHVVVRHVRVPATQLALRWLAGFGPGHRTRSPFRYVVYLRRELDIIQEMLRIYSINRSGNSDYD